MLSRYVSDVCYVTIDLPLPQAQVRRSFYGSLEDVSQASEIKAPFFDPLGNHVMFPPELADPMTGFIFAYPNWSADAETQVEFFVRVLNWIRSTAPTNPTNFSVYARVMTEKLLIEMILDGPWTTCTTYWKTVAKFPERPQEIRRAVRRKKRITNVSASPTRWLPGLPLYRNVSS
jgi:hypothetical protein